MSEKAVERYRDNVFILMMLASGRRFEDTQAIETWCNDRNSEGTRFSSSFNMFSTWKGKAENSDCS